MAKAKATKTEPPKPPPEVRYFEHGDKFWELSVEELAITTRTGKRGAAGQTKLKAFDKGYETTHEARKLVRAKTKAGFVETLPGERSSHHVNAALEKTLRADPTDAATFAVYADWLQAQGDPRGELAALQIAGQDKAAAKFLKANAAHLLGPLIDRQRCFDGNDKKKQAFTWKHGFIAAARLAHNQYGDNWKGVLATDVLLPLLQHPSGKFLVELTLNDNDDPSEDTLDDLFAMIAEHPIPTLRKLRIGDDVPQISWYRVGNVGKAWSGLPNLTHFDIEAGEFSLGEITLPHLVHAVFYTGGLSKAAAASIANATWPKLEHLEVYFGDPEYGCTAKLADALAILESCKRLKHLRYLGLENAEFQAELIPHLAASKVTKQLHTLDMSDGILLDEHVDLLLTHRDAFAHLEVLDVSNTWLTKKAIARLAGVARTIRAENCWHDANPEFRYVRVGE
jgi:uncharacterized protein (TIGR02996 family)